MNHPGLNLERVPLFRDSKGSAPDMRLPVEKGRIFQVLRCAAPQAFEKLLAVPSLARALTRPAQHLLTPVDTTVRAPN